MLHAPPLRGYFELSLQNATLHVSSATISDNVYSELLVYLGSQLNDNRCVIHRTERDFYPPNATSVCVSSDLL